MAWPTRREAAVGLSGLIKRQNGAVLTRGYKVVYVPAFTPIHFLAAHSYAGIAWTGLVAAALGAGEREVDLATGTRQMLVVSRHTTP